MTDREKLLLKHWLCAEDFRLFEKVRETSAGFAVHPNVYYARSAYEALAEYRAFQRFMFDLMKLVKL